MDQKLLNLVFLNSWASLSHLKFFRALHSQIRGKDTLAKYDVYHAYASSSSLFHECNIIQVDVEQRAPMELHAGTWWTRNHGDSRISLAGIWSGITAQHKVDILRRLHEVREGSLYDVGVRMRFDLYRADKPEERVWNMIAQAALVPDAIFSCRRFRWPGLKGGDMCFIALSVPLLDTLYATWLATARTVLKAMACSWKVRSRACGTTQARLCAATVTECGHDDELRFPENLMAVAMKEAKIRSRASGTLPTSTTFSPAIKTSAYSCGEKGLSKGSCLSTYTPCPMTDLTQWQCEEQCEMVQACSSYLFTQGRRCYLYSNRGKPPKSARSSSCVHVLCSKLGQRSPLGSARWTSGTPSSMRSDAQQMNSLRVETAAFANWRPSSMASTVVAPPS